MAEYKHGAYAEIVSGEGALSPITAATLPVYFGVAPVHQLMDYAGKVGEPLLLTGYEQARRLCGYADSWSDFSLSEAVYAHFRMDREPIGPIVLINAINPDTDRKAAKTTAEVTFVAKTARILNNKIILKTVSIAAKVLGTDYTAEYLADGSGILLTDIRAGFAGQVTVEFFELSFTTVTADRVAASVIANIGKVYERANQVPTLLLAPGWSTVKQVNDALKAAAYKINGHWFAMVINDIDAEANGSIAAAIAAKTADGKLSEIEVPCWPLVRSGDRTMHLSTLSAVVAQRVDTQNGGIPCETPSNKPISVSGLVVAKGGGVYEDIRFDQTEANTLNANGIRTASFWGGRYKLWGAQTGAYSLGGAADPAFIFDSSVRMLHYVANSFQLRYGDVVDKPMMRSRIDTILNDMQEWLDGLVQARAMLHAAISFLPEENPTSDLITGEFVFDTSMTTTPPARSITTKVRYTSEGISTLTGGDQA